MISDLDEKKIRELFRELKQEDELSAPPFARDWPGWSMSVERTRSRPFVLLFVATAVALTLACGSIFILVKRSSRPPVSSVISELPASTAGVQPPAPSMPTPALRAPSQNSRSMPSQHQPSAILISQWKSPTEFLLRPPGELMLKNIPRLNESLVTIRTLHPDETN